MEALLGPIVDIGCSFRAVEPETLVPVVPVVVRIDVGGIGRVGIVGLRGGGAPLGRRGQPRRTSLGVLVFERPGS
jgi:hypothetical protein